MTGTLIRSRAAVVLYALVCGACTVPVGETVPYGTPPAPAPATSATMAAAAEGVIAEVNRTRRAEGQRALIEDAALSRAARQHAEELASRRRLDHSSIDPERRTMAMRIEAAGGTWMQAAENLASTSGSSSQVASEAVQIWLRSEGHRRNMLSPEYTHTGAGVAIDRHGIWYITQLYVLPRTDR